MGGAYDRLAKKKIHAEALLKIRITQRCLLVCEAVYFAAFLSGCVASHKSLL